MSSISIDESIGQDRFRKGTLWSSILALIPDWNGDSDDTLVLYFDA